MAFFSRSVRVLLAAASRFTMAKYPGVHESLARLRGAGWSPVEEWWSYPRGRRLYRVVVGKDGQEVCGEGRGAAEAWWRTAEQALGQGPGVSAGR